MMMARILALAWLIEGLPFPNALFGQDSKLVDAAKGGR
jgi:hypothetical protein